MNEFRLSKQGDFQALAPVDQISIKKSLEGLVAGKDVVYISLQEWQADGHIEVILNDVHTQTYGEDANYRASGGSWHYVDVTTMQDIIAGRLN